MTVKEMFENKYKDYMANITPKAWELHQYNAERNKIPVYEHIILSIEITEKDFYNNGIYYGGCELENLHKEKLLASNRHKSDCRNPAKFWLTKKGYKQLFEQ